MLQKTKFLISCISFFLLLSGSSPEVFAQKITLNGTASDIKTGLPIAEVSVQSTKSGKATVTNKSGSFSLQTDTIFSSEILKFTHLGYETFTLKLQPGKNNYAVKLTPKNNPIPEVKITALKKLKPEKLRPETIIDYALTGNRLYILGWETGQKNPALQVLDLEKDSLLSKHYLSFYGESLYVDCLENLHILTETNGYQVYYDSGFLQLYPPNTKTEFERILKPCLATSGDNLYFRQNINKGVVVNFFAINVKTHKSKPVTVIQDEIVLKMQQGENRFQKLRLEREIDLGARYQNKDRLARSSARSANFAKLILFEPPYIPLLKIGSQIGLFDHVNGEIELYEADSLKQITPVTYHLQKDWARQVLIDASTEKAYALFQKNGLYELRNLNLETGETETTYKISNPFATKISVQNGQLYFLHKDPEKQNRQFLYKAPLSNF